MRTAAYEAKHQKLTDDLRSKSMSQKILLVGDIHLSDTAPSSCTDSYLDDIFALLEHSVIKSKELGVDAVVYAGDVFHHKQPSRTSHATVHRAIDLIQSYDVPLYIVPGNHDMAHDRFESLAETQPLGTLLKAGAILLKGFDTQNDLPIYGIPWLQRWDQQDVEKAFVEWHEDQRDLSNCLVIAHAPLYPPGNEMTFEYYPVKAKAGEIDDRSPWNEIQSLGFCYYGHVHEAHGIYRVGNVNFCNVGAITRGSLHESELKRAVKLAVWDSATGFAEVPIPYKPADQVFKLMEKAEAVDTQIRLDEFLSSMGESTIEITSIEQVISEIRDTYALHPELMKLLEELLLEESH
jgi:Icc-related predicted phosphoesterase